MATVPGILLALLCMEHCLGGAIGDYTATTAELISFLFVEYDSLVIPAYQGPVKVVHSLQLLRVLDFDPHKQTATLNVWSSMRWTDPRLHFDPASSIDNTTKLWVPSKRLWQPDVVLSSGGPTLSVDKALLHTDGEIYYPSLPTTLTTYCSQTNITNEFECQLKFFSWVYDASMLDLQIKNNSADLSVLVESDYQKWEVVSFTVDRNVVQYACCPEPYIILVYKLRTRQPGFIADSVNMRVKSGGQCSVIQNGHTVLSVALGSLVLWLWSQW